mmetsp:Transcript_27787/g.74972  ORF Transcript_27787/g.74972 Transcript_27787/m.74972 type:complete len:81 (-) Transcript_27787:97-339(-)
MTVGRGVVQAAQAAQGAQVVQDARVALEDNGSDQGRQMFTGLSELASEKDGELQSIVRQTTVPGERSVEVTPPTHSRKRT